MYKVVTVYIVGTMILFLPVGSVFAKTKKSQAPKTAPTSVSDEFVVEKPAFVFVAATDERMQQAIAALKAKYNADDLSEIASDSGYYEMQVRDFAVKKKVPVFDTNKKFVVFKKKGGESIRIENVNESIGTHIYMWNGLSKPRLIEDQPGFSDGREFQEYFGGAGKSVKKK